MGMVKDINAEKSPFDDRLDLIIERDREWLRRWTTARLNTQSDLDKWKATHTTTTKEFEIAWAYAKNRIPMGSAQLNRLKEKMTKEEKKFLGLK
jgi:hypothetical protein